jgi:hypothetical protein
MYNRAYFADSSISAKYKKIAPLKISRYTVLHTYDATSRSEMEGKPSLMPLALKMDMMIGATEIISVLKLEGKRDITLHTDRHLCSPTPAGMGEGQVSMVGVLHI